ncbi:MAG: hypothetical protein HQL63_00085 [Magnetococcales bacterium]|nr:hypothetical protein [Magnetococcales bacterium]MBF0323376.1 hypothetical protein [Magnetococcales bacterium]
MSNHIFSTLLRLSKTASIRLPARLRPVMFPRDDASQNPPAAVRSTDDILRDILAWDKQDANDLCVLLNSYDHLVLSGAQAPALDLRRVPSVDPTPHFRFGTPVQFVAMDLKARCVVRSGKPERFRYAVQNVAEM